MKKGNAIALLPIGVFVVLYLGLGILFEYGMKIPMGFYNIPIVVVFLVALLVACVQNKKLSFDEKLSIMGKGIGDKTIILMILIFLTAGVFVGVVGRQSAQSVAYLMLSVVPLQYAIAVLFVVSCIISVSMGTSVGTITLIVPIGAALAEVSGASMPLTIGSIMGGAMFGDNLSFISDTTIAACMGQNCDMKDKFRQNFGIALPAAIVTLILIVICSAGNINTGFTIPEYHLIQIIPYLIVLTCGIAGVHVMTTLILGIISGVIIMLATGTAAFTDLLGHMGAGASGMFETVMVATLVSAICALVREYGGFDALLNWLYHIFKGKKGGQIGMGVLVVLLDIATANNTVAIVMANPIASEMAEKYGISKQRTASLLDTFSCVSQGILPYGAQMLVAISAVAATDVAISAFEIIPFLFYPYVLLASSLFFIALGKN